MNEPAAEAHNVSDVQKAYSTGRLRFEIRGLTNEATKTGNGSRQYMHKAMVVAVGDPEYTKKVYLLVCSVKRLAGGDPEDPREEDHTGHHAGRNWAPKRSWGLSNEHRKMAARTNRDTARRCVPRYLDNWSAGTGKVRSQSVEMVLCE